MSCQQLGRHRLKNKKKRKLIAFFKEQENSTLDQIQTTILSQKNELSKGNSSNNTNVGANSNVTQAEPATSAVLNSNA